MQTASLQIPSRMLQTSVPDPESAGIELNERGTDAEV